MGQCFTHLYLELSERYNKEQQIWNKDIMSFCHSRHIRFRSGRSIGGINESNDSPVPLSFPAKLFQLKIAIVHFW